MRCSICGAKLKKEGDICTNCYKEFQEEEDLKKDNVETLKIKRKYAIKYEFMKYIEMIIIFILAFILCITSGGVLESIGVVLIAIAVFGLVLFVDKRLAMGTTVTFYEKKAVYRFNAFGITKTKVIKYTDIKDVTYFQTRRQKKFEFGDLCIYAKESLPGMGFFGGFQIKNIENPAEILQRIGEIVGPIEE